MTRTNHCVCFAPFDGSHSISVWTVQATGPTNAAKRFREESKNGHRPILCVHPNRAHAIACARENRDLGVSFPIDAHHCSGSV